MKELVSGNRRDSWHTRRWSPGTPDWRGALCEHGHRVDDPSSLDQIDAGPIRPGLRRTTRVRQENQCGCKQCDRYVHVASSKPAIALLNLFLAAAYQPRFTILHHSIADHRPQELTQLHVRKYLSEHEMFADPAEVSCAVVQICGGCQARKRVGNAWRRVQTRRMMCGFQSTGANV